jgi:hypothetical protein
MHPFLVRGLVLVALTGCGKDSAKQAAPAATSAAPAKSALAVKHLASLPLQAEVGPDWKIEVDKVTGGASLRTQTADVAIAQDGIDGLKKTTVEDERKLMSSLSAAPQEVAEDKLADGWVLSYKIPGVLPYHATVVRQLGGQGYRCVIQTEDAAGRADGLAICKGMKP